MRAQRLITWVSLSIALTLSGCYARARVGYHPPTVSGTVSVNVPSEVVVTAPPPPLAEPAVVAARPGPDAAWVPGHYEWEGRWNWVPGHWERNRAGYVWVAPVAHERGGSIVYHAGYWQPEGHAPPPVYATPGSVVVTHPPSSVEHVGGGATVVHATPAQGGATVVHATPGQGGTVVHATPGQGGTVVHATPGQGAQPPPPRGGTVVHATPGGGAVHATPGRGSAVSATPGHGATVTPGSGRGTVTATPGRGGSVRATPGHGATAAPGRGSVSATPGHGTTAAPGRGSVSATPGGGRGTVTATPGAGRGTVTATPGAGRGSASATPGRGSAVHATPGTAPSRGAAGQAAAPATRPGTVAVQPGTRPGTGTVAAQAGPVRTGGTATPSGHGAVIANPPQRAQPEPRAMNLTCRLDAPRAPMGGVVTITGTGFGAGVRVSIGGNLASVVSQAQGRVQVRVPGSPGGGMVRVTQGQRSANCGTLSISSR